MKNVLLLIHDDVGEEARLEAALDLTRALSGHLTCIDIMEMPMLIGTGVGMVEAQSLLLADVQAREAVNARRVKARLARDDVAWDWRNAGGDIASLIEEEARLADLIVLNTDLPGGERPDMLAVASDLVVRSGKPIMAIPADARRLDVGGTVLVAWNGSPPAAAALRAATPLVALSRDVMIVEIGEKDGSSGEAVEAAATYLSRHGIHPRIDGPIPVDGTVADTLLGLCRTQSPAYCVLGAYGHSRIRESLFGGVTRRMLSESPVPLLIAH